MEDIDEVRSQIFILKQKILLLEGKLADADDEIQELSTIVNKQSMIIASCVRGEPDFMGA